jgi:membrane-associated phospholipid phosphatase
LNSQDTIVYQVSKKTDLPILLTGTATGIYSFFKSSAVEKPTTEQLVARTRNDVPSFDRSATYNWNEQAADWSDITQVVSLALPVLLFTSDKIRNEKSSVVLMYVETFLVNQGLVSAIKSTVLRKRPYVYNEDVDFEIKYRKPVFYSFVSGHCAASAAMSFFTAKVYADFYPDSPYKKYVWIGASILPAVTGFLRYESGRHFPTDVIAGYGLGVLSGYLIPALHKKTHGEHMSLTLIGIQEGIGCQMTVQF